MKGHTVTRTLKDGSKRYDVVWRANGKQRWKTFSRSKDADKYRASVVKSVHDGVYQDVRPVAVSVLLDEWLAQAVDVNMKKRILKPSTANTYRSIVRKHLRPEFGTCRSDRLTRQAVEDWAARLADGIEEGTIAPKTYNNFLTLFHVIIGWARTKGYLAHDPLLGHKRAAVRAAERDFLEPPEIDVLLKAATPPDDTILHVAVYTGLRRGELFGLQWLDIDWGQGKDGGRLFVRRSLWRGRSTAPKTKYSSRVIDVSQRTLDELAVYRGMCPPKDGGYIFRTEHGRPLDPENWRRRRFLPILERAGLRRIGLHTMRHTYASLLINQNESIKYVSKQMGHASIQITADLYGHLFRETSVAAMRRLEEGMPAPLHLTPHLTEAAETP